jgi:hypothetical protein
MAAGGLALVSLAAIVMLYLAACHSAEGHSISPEESMEEEDKDFQFSFANTDELDVSSSSASSSSSSSSVKTQFDEVLPQLGNYESTADFYSRNQNPSSSSRPMGGAGGSSYYGVYSGYNSQEAYSHNSLKKPESLALASATAAWSAAHATFYGGANAEGTMGNK